MNSIGLAIKLGPADLAKYPFLEEASEYIRETRFAIEELDRPEMDHILRRSVDILETEISGGKVYTNLDKYEIEILSFLVTLIMIKSIDLEPVTKKHSLLEAMRAEKFLTEDLYKEKSLPKKDIINPGKNQMTNKNGVAKSVIIRVVLLAYFFNSSNLPSLYIDAKRGALT